MLVLRYPAMPYIVVRHTYHSIGKQRQPQKQSRMPMGRRDDVCWLFSWPPDSTRRLPSGLASVGTPSAPATNSSDQRVAAPAFHMLTTAVVLTAGFCNDGLTSKSSRSPRPEDALRAGSVGNERGVTSH